MTGERSNEDEELARRVDQLLDPEYRLGLNARGVVADLWQRFGAVRVERDALAAENERLRELAGDVEWLDYVKRAQAAEARAAALQTVIEAMEWTWHFRGPGDPGVKIVNRQAVLDLVRAAAVGAPEKPE